MVVEHKPEIFIVLPNFPLPGQSGSPTPCSAQNARVLHTENDRTASGHKWKYIGSVPNNPNEGIRKKDCRNKCERICVQEKEGGPNFRSWPGCVAFSSWVHSGGGTCYCYGWDQKPEWYPSSRYLSGWCEEKP